LRTGEAEVAKAWIRDRSEAAAFAMDAKCFVHYRLRGGSRFGYPLLILKDRFEKEEANLVKALFA